ncbi:DUF3272 domain-containing protein [Streptococcus suis]|nr:DUF3272 domain-containing protein [Streptococcus suis]
MKLLQFLFLAFATILATYFMNASILAGDFWIAGIYAFILFRNFHFAYKVTKIIRLFDGKSKK